MDPISALSIATAVIAFISFGTEVCKEVRDFSNAEGTSKTLVDLDLRSRRAQDLVERLALGNATTSQGIPRLNDVLRNCQTASQELAAVIESLRAIPNGSMKNLRTAVKSIWKKPMIEKLERTLIEAQQELDTHLLADLALSLDTFQGRLDSIFQKLSEDQKWILQAIADGKKSCEEITAHLRMEHYETRSYLYNVHLQTRHHTEQLFAFRERQMLQHDREKAVLDALYFPEMWDRQTMIQSAQLGTCDWILQDNAGFREWLERGSQLFWINGKLGSGKSTLVRYLIEQDEHIQAALRVWSQGKAVFSPGVFFWRNGTRNQNSIHGALRSLLYQILEHDSTLIDSLSAAKTRRHSAWTTAELRNGISRVLKRWNTHIFIFVDGLDEFLPSDDVTDEEEEGRYIGDETVRELIDIFEELSHLHRVKVCISSRPVPAWSGRFANKPQVKVENHTKQDIERYVKHRLSCIQNDYEDLQAIYATVVDRSEGVFLWVKLAMDIVERRMERHDTTNEIMHRLRGIPKELDKLYAGLLDELDPHDRQQASLIFALASRDPPDGAFCHLLAVNFAVARGTSRRIEIPITSPLDDDQAKLILAQVKKMCGRIRILSCGLLEVEKKYQNLADFYHLLQVVGFDGWREKMKLYFKSGNFKDLGTIADPCLGHRYSFIHRTAADFVKKKQKKSQSTNRTKQNLDQLFWYGLHDSLKFYRMVGLPSIAHDISGVRWAAVGSDYASWILRSYKRRGHLIEQLVICLLHRSSLLVLQDSPANNLAEQSKALDELSTFCHFIPTFHWSFMTSDSAEHAIAQSNTTRDLAGLPRLEFVALCARHGLKTYCLSRISSQHLAFETLYLLSAILVGRENKPHFACQYRRTRDQVTSLVHELVARNVDLRRHTMPNPQREPLTVWQYYLRRLAQYTITSTSVLSSFSSRSWDQVRWYDPDAITFHRDLALELSSFSKFELPQSYSEYFMMRQLHFQDETASESDLTAASPTNWSCIVEIEFTINQLSIPRQEHLSDNTNDKISRRINKPKMASEIPKLVDDCIGSCQISRIQDRRNGQAMVSVSKEQSRKILQVNPWWYQAAFVGPHHWVSTCYGTAAGMYALRDLFDSTPENAPAEHLSPFICQFFGLDDPDNLTEHEALPEDPEWVQFLKDTHVITE